MTASSHPLRVFRPLALIFALPLLMAGCSAGFGNSSQPETVAHVALSGKIYGGQQPVSGSTVYLYAASAAGTGSAAYGAGATNLLSRPVAGSPNANFVTTDSNGNFSITGDYTCSPGTQVYAVALNGSPGSGQPANSAIAMMTAIGDCAQLSAASFISINELTTVAGVTALQQFMTVSFGIPIIGTSAANATGLANAFANANALVPFSTGVVRANTAAVTYPTQEINTLGDVLAACINSSGPTSSSCGTLFADSPGTVAPTNTMQAMLNIAQTPAANPSGLFSLVTAQSPFQPTLAAAPNDFTVAVTYRGGSMYSPLNLAIDAAGNAFVFDCEISCTLAAPSPTTNLADKIVEFSPTGAVLTPAGGITGAGVHNAAGLVIDSAAFLWTANTGATRSGSGNANDSIGHYPAASNANGGTSFISANLNRPYGIALDPTGNAYVTNMGNSGIDYVTSAGVVSTPFTTANAVPLGLALTPGNLLYVADAGNNVINKYAVNAGAITFQSATNLGDVNQPNGVAIDASNNAWYVNSGGTPSVALLTPGGTRIGPLGATGFGTIAAIAIGGRSRAWVPSCNTTCVTAGGVGNSAPDSVVEIGINGSSLALISPPQGFRAASLAAPGGIAIDASGNVWVTNTSAPNGTVTVFLGAAGPVQTPLQAALINNKLGQLP